MYRKSNQYVSIIAKPSLHSGVYDLLIVCFTSMTALFFIV